MPTIKTKWFSSGMAGAPALSGTVGAMIAVLDACLKNGFNLTTLTSLVIASNVAKATKAGHGYIVNQALDVEGITGACAEINGQVRVASVTTDTFTFAAGGISDQTATGTITCKASPAGWVKPFSATNLGVYRSGNGLSSLQCIKVDDTVGQYSSVTGAEDYTDISTAVSAFGTNYFKKSSTTDATARPWVLVADDKTVYLGVAWNSGAAYDFYSFGDFNSTIPADGAIFRLQGLANAAPGSVGQYSSCNDAYTYAPNQGVVSRAYSQIFGATPIHQASMCAASSMGSATSYLTYHWALSANRGVSTTANAPAYATPALGDNGYHFLPVYLFESTASGLSIRGVARGLLHVLEYLPFASGYQVQVGVDNVPEGIVLMVRSAGQAVSGAGPAYTYPSAVLAFKLGDF